MIQHPTSHMQLVPKTESSDPELGTLSMSDSTALVEFSDRLIHPSFSSPDADIILAARNATKYFRLHSYTLKTTSGFFRDMLSLPQKSHQISGPLYLDEDETTLEHLFRMISGLSVPPIDSYDLIDSLLDAVEKYDMPGPLSIIRLLLMRPPLSNEPFRLYAVASRFGWDEEAKIASTQTLSRDLYDSELRPLLSKLPSQALLRLYELHRSRREILRQRLNDPPFVSGGTVACINCHSEINYHTWRELKYKIILEMDAKPLGDTILDYGLTEWPEAQACWQAKCPNTNCSRALYDKGETLRVVRECIDKLPACISFI